MMHRVSSLASIALLLAGCAGGSVLAPVAAPSLTSDGIGGAGGNGYYLYSVNAGKKVLKVVRLPQGTIERRAIHGLSAPHLLAVDSTGRLYVGNLGSIAVFERGAPAFRARSFGALQKSVGQWPHLRTTLNTLKAASSDSYSGLALSPDGSSAFIADTTTGSVLEYTRFGNGKPPAHRTIPNVAGQSLITGPL